MRQKQAMSRGGLRVAYLAGFSPRKLGTGENRLVALARAARERGHTITFFGYEPVHPMVAEEWAAVGATWERLRGLGERPLASVRRLAREFDVIQLNAIAPRSRIAAVAYAAWPTPVLFVDHVSGPPDSGGLPVKRSLPRRELDRITMIRVRHFAGVSDYVRRRGEHRFGLSADRTLTVYGGVDTIRFHPPDSRPRSLEKGVRITCVAALIPEKGVGTLLRAVSRIPPGGWELRIVGSGPEAGALERSARALGLGERVEFLGLRDDVDEILRDTHILVHPAVWEEALGYTVLEGMASGCAVIASRVGGIPELIRDGLEGMLVEPGNVEHLTKALVDLLRDAEDRGRLGEAARRRVVQDFSLERNVRLTLDWFEAAAGGRSLHELKTSLRVAEAEQLEKGDNQ